MYGPVIERLMRMGIEHRTGKYTDLELWNLTTRQIAEGDRTRQRPIITAEDKDALQLYAKCCAHPFMYALIRDKGHPEIVRMLAIPGDRRLIGWTSEPKYTASKWIQGMPEFSEVVRQHG